MLIKQYNCYGKCICCPKAAKSSINVYDMKENKYMYISQFQRCMEELRDEDLPVLSQPPVSITAYVFCRKVCIVSMLI